MNDIIHTPANHHKVLILDFGSQYTQLIARRIREEKVYCEIIPCFEEFSTERMVNVEAIVLSGGPGSVTAAELPDFDVRWLETGKPVLGVCYGMQLLANHFGGEVGASLKREYGHAQITLSSVSDLFCDVPASSSVWMSHGDHVIRIPENFELYAASHDIPVAAMGSATHKIFALQFHPEVVHSPEGKTIIRNFLFKIAKLKPDWTPDNLVDEISADIREKVAGSDQTVLCGLSGGVDSTVAAILLDRAIPGQLKCLFVNNGLLRKNEAEEVQKALGKDGYGLDLTVIDASEEFLSGLSGVIDPEQKRKIIGNLFIDIFEREAKKLNNVKYLVQGTLYPDVIESVSVRGPSAVIKSHHNVGGLPDRMDLALIEPFRELFKDEVRELGRNLEIPDSIIDRQPFPGPGLAVRILGEVNHAQVEILQNADAIVQQEVLAAGLYTSIWQSFAVLLPVKSVGVMGDNRTYEQCIAVRSVDSLDGMTADWTYLPQQLLRKISNRIINEVSGINRVVLDISSKPPATIEWE